uniref:GNAT family N-acetyltransferase n=1 Tax=uncultured Altererythrobacter sp. TaxID=500840 RepID=UPI00261DCFAD|nr:GNAT family N-acetyltransferase [uncultured Altererythrobacter sp.]
MAFAVRPVDSADAPELAQLINQIIAAGGTTAIEEPFTAEALDSAYLTGADVQCCYVAVDEADNSLQGFQTLVRNPSLPEGVGDIATFARIDGKQKGVGTALFEETRKAAERLGNSQINATIRADNVGAIGFYSKMGFTDHTVTEGLPLKDGTPVDRVHKRFVLGRDLSGNERKTLQLREPSDTADASPNLKKKGRGWEISEKRLDALHDQAREMKRFASPAHKALAARFTKADLGRYTFKRFAVVGSAIVDFNCHNLGMAIAIDEEGQNDAIAKRRDKSLEAVNIRVMRIKASDILENMDAVLDRITAGMRMRISDKRDARREHFERSTPRQNKHSDNTQSSGRTNEQNGGDE